MRKVPRLKALQILTDVLANGRPLDEAIEAFCTGGNGKGPPVAPEDRGWLVEVTSGVLRNRGRLDLAIDAYALKKKPSGKIRKILEIAVYQLLHQDRVFPATVVSETVDFIKSEEGEAPARFANALLRKIADSRDEWSSFAAPEASAPIAEKAAWANLPEWWWGKWEKAYGFETAQKIAEASSSRPEIWFRLRPDAKDSLSFLESGPVPGSAKQKEQASAGEISSLPGYAEGKWIIQDLASQILENRFAEILRSKNAKSSRVLDRCAAPGGKAIALSWLGMDVTATDTNPQRKKLLMSSVARAAPTVKVVDENEMASQAPFDAVWIDAPCSGSGILRRHPDVRWSKKPEDLLPLVAIQKKLIGEAFKLVPKGGLVFYTVCSLFSEEGKGHLVEVLANADCPVKIREEILLTPAGEPSSDGFYGVVFERL
ncbi:MAG: hypothetical protein H7301_09995 [Cryobacterium sp.]|nr:hypothetical protein [Oligoflexia bacterium]